MSQPSGTLPSGLKISRAVTMYNRITGYSNRKSQLYKAILSNNINLVKNLIEHGVDVNTQYPNHSNYTPLNLAISVNNIEIIKLLVESGANVNLNDTLKQTCINSNLDIARFLVENGADVNNGREDGDTPLMRACNGENNLEILRVLVENGADVNNAMIDGTTPLMMACRRRDNLEKVRILVEAGADLHAVNKNGKTALYYGIVGSFLDEFKIVRFLVEHGVRNGIQEYIEELKYVEHLKGVLAYLRGILRGPPANPTTLKPPSIPPPSVNMSKPPATPQGGSKKTRKHPRKSRRKTYSRR